ncbi:hypothetical protein OCO52_18795 [Achromobacter mucicolens]|uniref:hypothetical protein n=1 Tax=Achromobacter mucicolens TaxID=1389922 RepID=UPI0021D2538A|nr:hypothetical protein [Achromobacter mucicolens]MCU6618541.1 hypothetical protein [Achromobacter mucicolens]
MYDKPMMARMAEAASGAAGKGLGGTDGAGQAAHIFGALEKLPAFIGQFSSRALRPGRIAASAARAP